METIMNEEIFMKLTPQEKCEHITSKMQKRIFNICSMHIDNPQGKEDVNMMILSKIWSCINKLNYRNYRSYITKIALNTIKNYYRDNNRYRSFIIIDNDLVDNYCEKPNTDFDLTLNDFYQGLEKRTALIFSKIIFDQMSYVSVSKMMGIKHYTVRYLYKKTKSIARVYFS